MTDCMYDGAVVVLDSICVVCISTDFGYDCNVWDVTAMLTSPHRVKRLTRVPWIRPTFVSVG